MEKHANAVGAFWQISMQMGGGEDRWSRRALRGLPNYRGSQMKLVGSPRVCSLQGELFQLHFLVFCGCLKKPRKDTFLLFPAPLTFPLNG